MHSRTCESKTCPGASFTVRPINGPLAIDLTSDRVTTGTAFYNAFRHCCTNWADAPMLGGDVSEKFDAAVIEYLLPSFVQEAVMEALNYWTLTEEERKNS